MKLFKVTAIILFTILFMSHQESEAAPGVQISYNVSFPEAQAHYADIEMTVTGLKQPTLELKMPVWTPGSYLVREFAKNVEQLTATANGKAVDAPKITKNTWKINTAGVSTVKVKYKLYAFEISVRTAFIDASHGFLSTSGVFLYPKGMLNQPSTIHITPYKGWDKVSTSLAMVNNDPFTVTAPNYDILFDSPIEVGNQDVFGFKAAGVNYEVAMYGGGNYDKERLKKDMARIVEEETAIFGENPNKRYVFIVHNYARGGGGLEHLSSTVLGASRNQYANERGYQGFLGLVAHEHFHLWNVKRLRPVALGPFDYENENYTTNLWIAEGFTAYYQNVAVNRMDLYPTDNFLAQTASNFASVDNTPGAKYQSAAESSFDAWIKYYRPNENSNNTGISYYNKGAVIATLLDLEIINDTKGAKSLDDVMRYMYNQCKTKGRGYTDAEFKAALEQFAGRKLDDFYAKYVNGVETPDYDKYLGYAGYKMIDERASSNEPTLGIQTTRGANKIVVSGVTRGTGAWNDGINVNDEITAIDGNAVTSLEGALNGKNVGDKINVTLMRDGQSMTIPLTLTRNTMVRYKITSVDNPSAAQLAVRKKWLTL